MTTVIAAGSANGDSAHRALRASVIIPTYNRSEMLRSTLECLCAQSLPADEYEVVVADDGSSDDTRQVVDSFAGKLQAKYHFQEDLGFRAAAARNAGARLAQAPVLIFLDTGTLAGRGFVAAHLEAHTAPDAAGRAVIGYVHGYPPANVEDPGFEPLPGLAEDIARLTPEQVVARYRDEPRFRDSRHAEFEKVNFDLAARTVPEELFRTSNCSVQATDFWAISGFDEDYRRWGMEDSDLGYRLHRNGASFYLSTDAWAVEMQHERDDAANFEQLLQNVQMFLDKYQYSDPLLELLWLMLISGTAVLGTLETMNRAIADWIPGAREVDVSARLAEEFARTPQGMRVAVFGAGPVVPPGAPPSVLADFDPEVAGRLRAADGGHDVRHNVGIRTALADGAVDVVLITRRLSGIWDRYGSAILAEAHRIGAQVRCLFDVGTATGRLG